MNQPQFGNFDFTRQLPPSPEDVALRELEQTLAYLHASGEIESGCMVAEAVCIAAGGVGLADAEETVDRPWYDLHTRDRDLADEVKYLCARQLLEIHPVHRNWVRICDESEPMIGQVN